MDRVTYVVLLVAACVMYAVATIFNSLSGGGPNAIFKSNTGDISDKYYQEVTPAGWTFSIWGVIYIWETLWLVYAIVNIFRKTESGFVFNNPELMSAPFFVIFTINMGMNLAWIFLFDRQHLEPCLAILFLMYVTLYMCLFLSYRALDQNLQSLQKQERKADIWLTRILVQNGLSVYATWCTIATNLNLSMVLIYRGSLDLSVHDGGTVTLSVIAAQILVFVVLDFFFWDRYTRYTLTPYCVVIVALVGSLTKNYSEGNRNTIFTIVLLSIAVAIFIIKIVLTIVRHIRNPLKGMIISETKENLKNQVV
ncbi:uncharacterized protein LOC143067561 [Mytilus galloprovincialis]|uniref:uncharacterized protein LOC143067561 n=1 Tax=Mytilus galloprovincialis TaxID=29158 RepID=UPI003F7C31EB